MYLEQAHYASSTINLPLAAVSRLACEAADAGLLSQDLAATNASRGLRFHVWRSRIADKGKGLHRFACLGIPDRNAVAF
jgi:hypothetical protein